MANFYNDSIFSSKIHINAGDVTPGGKLGLGKLMLLFQDVALAHYTSRAQTWDELFKEKKSWILNKIEIDVKSLPKLATDVTLSTWSFSVEAHKGIREFEMKDASDEVLLTGIMTFIYFDFVSRKPIAFDKDKFPNFTQTPKTNFNHNNEWILENFVTPDFSSTYNLRYSDFDLNNHVNNIIYFDLVDDFVKTRIGKESFSNIKAIYKKEIPFGTKNVDVATKLVKDKYMVSITNENQLYFLAEVY